MNELFEPMQAGLIGHSPSVDQVIVMKKACAQDGLPQTSKKSSSIFFKCNTSSSRQPTL